MIGSETRQADFAEPLLEALPIGVYVCNADGTIRTFNREATRLWGRSPAVGDTDERFCGALRLYWPDGRPLPHAETPMAAALATGEPATNLDVCIERPDGVTLTVLVNIVPLRDAQGRIAGAVNCFHDVSEMRHTQSALRDSRSFLETIIQTTPECVKIVARDGRLLRMNAAGLRMVEAAAWRDVEGANVFDLVAPEHRDVWRARHERVCDGETLSWEFDIVGLGGTRRHMETHAAPLLVDGEIAQLAITHDITERVRQRRRLEASERQARELLEALPAAVYTTDAEGRITFYNQAAATLWGQQPPLGSLWCGSWKIYTPEGDLLPHDQCPMARALKEQRPVRNVEAVAERPDGTRVPFMPYPTPLFDSEGRLVGAVNMLVDISFHKAAEARQRDLINELNHRVKNSLATVQSIAQQTLRHADTAEAFRAGFSQRLVALSRAHDLLTRGAWAGADLRALLQTVLQPYDGEGRIGLEGPALALPPRTALAVAMAANELATNAAKHGALSRPTGRLRIEWRLAEDTLRLAWTEQDGPPVVAPQRQGFGLRLLERTFAAELKGSVQLEFAASGLRCVLTAPLPAA